MSAYYGDVIPQLAASQPDEPAIVTDDGILTFAGFHQAILGRARAFHAAGVEPGRAVGLVMRDTGAHIVALFALQRLGAAVLPLAPGDPPALTAALVAQAEARVVVGAAADREGHAVRFVDIDAADAPDAELPPPPGPDDVCSLHRSSGTTGGVPRLTPSLHRQERAQSAIQASLQAWPAGDRYMKMIATTFDFGRKSIQHALVGGGAIILPPPLPTLDDIVSAAARLGATWTSLTPPHLRHLLGADGPRPLLPGVAIVTSSAVLTAPERKAVMERLSPDLHMVYGTNEVGVLAYARPDELRRVAGTVGRVPPAIEVQVVDDDNRPLPAGTVGELRFRHPDYPTAYATPDPNSPSRFADGWFYPGDLGLLDDEGLLFLKGRSDDMINVGGRKVYPIDIEECLSGHPGVVEAVAVGMPSARKGSVAVGVVVLREPVPVPELLAHCVARLGRDRAPDSIVVAPQFPRTLVGKVDRVALREQIVAKSRTGKRGDG